MRRKISKRKRRDILAKGGVFTTEDRIYCYDYSGKKEKVGYSAHVFYCGWEIYGCGKDELEAYKSVLDTMPWCEENPRDETNGYISLLSGDQIPVTGVWKII